MTQQYEFFNRDLLEEACNLRLTGPKDLLHHFVKNNARNFEPDTTKDALVPTRAGGIGREAQGA